MKDHVKEVKTRMKTMKALKAKELALASTLIKLVRFAKYVEKKVENYSKSAIEKLQVELNKQKTIRQERLDLLALEELRIRDEIQELEEAEAKHGEKLANLNV